jgi:hypothetical protein
VVSCSWLSCLHTNGTGLLSWYIQLWDIMQSDRKRELLALPNEELRHMLSRLMTLMHLGLVMVYLVAYKVLSTKLLLWYVPCSDIVQSDRKRELSALPNEELHNTLSRRMTLMHSWLIGATLVAGKCLHTVVTEETNLQCTELKHCAAHNKDGFQCCQT